MPSRVSTPGTVPAAVDPAPCRHLAARVIEQALKDVLQPGQTATDRQSARSFLAGSTMLSYWCEVAGLDASQVIHMAAVLSGTNEHGGTASWTRASERPVRAHV